jgi:hypothetical protein
VTWLALGGNASIGRVATKFRWRPYIIDNYGGFMLIDPHSRSGEMLR